MRKACDGTRSSEIRCAAGTGPFAPGGRSGQASQPASPAPHARRRLRGRSRRHPCPSNPSSAPFFFLRGFKRIITPWAKFKVRKKVWKTESNQERTPLTMRHFHSTSCLAFILGNLIFPILESVSVPTWGPISNIRFAPSLQST